MQKHTQGEWVTHRNTITKQWQVWARNGKSGSKICDVFEGDHHEGDDLPQEDTIFNARLIAISPKLLDKLQKNVKISVIPKILAMPQHHNRSAKVISNHAIIFH